MKPVPSVPPLCSTPLPLYHSPLMTYQESGGLVVQGHVYLSHTVPHLGAGN